MYMIYINLVRMPQLANEEPSKSVRAKVFWTGRSQAVRLPKAYRLYGDEVVIRREGDAIILEPLEKRPWPDGYWGSFGPLGDDFHAPESLPASGHRDRALEEL
jgi:antitoxin VapB